MTNKLVLALVFFLFMFVYPPSAYALSCLATISPSTVDLGSSSLSYLITNQGPESVTAVKIISVDGSVFQISGGNTAGWSASVNGEELTFIGSTMIENQVVTFGFSVNALVESSPVSLDAYVSSDGVDFSSQCSGSGEVGVQIGVTPTISNVNLTVGNSSATLTWNTSVAATGVVNYGKTSGYGSSVTTASGTSHSATMSGLSASTTYNYQIIASGAGGTTSTANATFTTSAANVTTTTTTTVTNTVTQTETVTKIITDTTPPVLKIEALEKRVWESAPLITGSVSDDRGVAKVEYRIQNREESWSGAGLEGSVGAKKMAFEFVPPVSLDGTYTIEVRGVDVFGNVSVPKTIEFVIDQLLPTVGGGVISYGALPLRAEGGVVTVLAGREYEVVLYENGGADEVIIEFSNHKFSNSQMGLQGLWRSLIKFEETGEFTSMVKAVDGAGNETEREWVKFKVIPSSKQAGELYYLDPTTKRFGLWEAGEYGQKQGEIGWYAPKGEYYVADGKVISQRIVMEQDGWISGEWKIEKVRWWEKLFGWRRQAQLVLQMSEEGIEPARTVLAGREKWIGKKSIVYVGTKELPWYGETKRRAEEWAADEGAQLVELGVQGVDDPKGEWLEKLQVGLLPQVYLISDRGDVTDYKEGVWER